LALRLPLLFKYQIIYASVSQQRKDMNTLGHKGEYLHHTCFGVKLKIVQM